MSIRTLNDSEDAVSAVVSAVLMFGLAVALLTVIQVQYVPEWKTGAEQAHMADVYYDMSLLRSNMNLLATVAMTNDPANAMVFSSPVRVGGGSIPIIGPGGSSGVLGTAPDTFGMRVTSNPVNGLVSDLDSLGTLSFRSGNNYYVDQSYILEGGALILVQGERALMRQSPPISIRRTHNNGNITMYLHAMQIGGPSKAISSNMVEEVRTRCTSSLPLLRDDLVFSDMTLIVYTSYPSVWFEFFEKELKDAGLLSGEYSLSKNSNSVTLILRGAPGADIRANVRKSTFEVGFDVI